MENFRFGGVYYVHFVKIVEVRLGESKNERPQYVGGDLKLVSNSSNVFLMSSFNQYCIINLRPQF